MPSRQNPPPRRRGRPAKPQLATSREIVWVDSSHHRRKALADFRRSQTTFRKAEAELTEYTERDEPAFHQWFHGHFGPKIQEMEHLRRSADALRERWQRLVALQHEYHCSPREAEQFAEDEDIQLKKEAERDPGERENARRRMEEEVEKRKQEAFRELEEELMLLLRQSGREMRSYLRRGGNARALLLEIADNLMELVEVPDFIVFEFLMQPRIQERLREFGLGDKAETDTPKAPPVDDVAARIKQLARELAFALHPDQSGDSDPRKIELWHEVQAAVKARDLDRLEVLHAHMQAMSGEFSAGTPLSRILGVIQMFRESREALRRRIRELRGTPAWGFAKLTPEKRDLLQRRQAAKLDAEARQAREELEAIERDFKIWQRSRARPRPAPIRLEDLFF